MEEVFGRSLLVGAPATEPDFGPTAKDREEAALTERVSVGPKSATLQVSPVRQFPDYGPDVDVVQTWVLWDDGKVAALRDVYPNVSRQEAYELWTYLCEQLANSAALAYGLDVVPGVNPKLGCWGPRPELLDEGVDDDSATAVMIGVAVDRREAARVPNPELFVLAVRSGLVAGLKSWYEAARSRASASHKRN